MTNELTSDLILRDLRTATIGRAVEHYARVGSTNDIVRQRARAGLAEGLVVLAEEQTAGRGRLGRAWAAPPGSSLLMSLLLRPAWLPPADVFALTMLCGVALCEAIEQVVPIQAALKWPNDLLLPARDGAGLVFHKAAGILSELELDADRIAWMAIGMGINVNWAPQGSVDGRDLSQVATSVGSAAGQPVDRLELLRALLVRLDERYAALHRGQREELFETWRGRLALLGQPVTVRLPAGELHGVAAGIHPSGALLVRDESGIVHTILAGDVGV